MAAALSLTVARSTVAVLLVLASLLVSPPALMPIAHAVEVELPANAIEADCAGLWFIDLEKLDAGAFVETLDALVAAAPEAQREAFREKLDDASDEAAPLFDALIELRAAGARVVVLADGERGDGGEPAEGAGRDASAASDDAGGHNQMFVLASADADFGRGGTAALRDVIQAIVNMESEEAADGPVATGTAGDAASSVDVDAEPGGDAPDPASIELRPLEGGWWAVLGDELAPPVSGDGPSLDTEPYVQALQREQGAALRFAWLMTDDARADLQREMTSGPAAMFLMGVLGPLQEMEDATVGVWLGEQPRVRITANFSDATAAHRMKSGVDSLIVTVSSLMSLLPSDDAAEQQEQQRLRDALALLFPGLDGSTVSKTMDTDLLRRLSEAGVPWTGIEPEPAE